MCVNLHSYFSACLVVCLSFPGRRRDHGELPQSHWVWEPQRWPQQVQRLHVSSFSSYSGQTHLPLFTWVHSAVRFIYRISVTIFAAYILACIINLCNVHSVLFCGCCLAISLSIMSFSKVFKKKLPSDGPRVTAAKWWGHTVEQQKQQKMLIIFNSLFKYFVYSES